MQMWGPYAESNLIQSTVVFAGVEACALFCFQLFLKLSLERTAGRRQLRGRCNELKRHAPTRNLTACVGASYLPCCYSWKHRSPKPVLVPSHSGSRPQIAHRLLYTRSLDVGPLFSLSRLNLTSALARLGITLSIWKPSMKKSGRNSMVANTLAR